ncbi:hypothetical protein ACIBI3_01415 [Actinomadura luteofluorescens]|uniref:hypothetical protein n=1 Tax=Actinomadura luteofluorescens TaxID=46163 RepID=UPI00346C0ECB
MIKIVPLTVLALAATATLTAPGAHAATTRAGELINCQQVEVELPNLFARQCDTSAWGPLAEFVVNDRSTRKLYQCEEGWAEGSLWVRGQNCRELPTGQA